MLMPRRRPARWCLRWPYSEISLRPRRWRTRPAAGGAARHRRVGMHGWAGPRAAPPAAVVPSPCTAWASPVPARYGRSSPTAPPIPNCAEQARSARRCSSSNPHPPASKSRGSGRFSAVRHSDSRRRGMRRSTAGSSSGVQRSMPSRDTSLRKGRRSSSASSGSWDGGKEGVQAGGQGRWRRAGGQVCMHRPGPWWGRSPRSLEAPSRVCAAQRPAAKAKRTGGERDVLQVCQGAGGQLNKARVCQHLRWW